MAASGRMVFVAGQIGWNAACQFESDDFIAQVRQTLLNIKAVLAEAGAGPQHMVRMTWYVLDKREYLARGREVGQAYREVLGQDYQIAMSAVQVVGLMEDRAKVEIEVTAVLPA
ncbi:RidA family protein [Roseateles sp. GG27B]